MYSIVNRTRFTLSNHPLRTKNPHELIFFVDAKNTDKNVSLDLSNMEPPRLMSTHMPYSSLPTSVKESECRVVCMARNPMDTFVSMWKFLTQIHPEFLQQMTIDNYSEIFCNGEEVAGPYWDHVLGYWKESLD